MTSFKNRLKTPEAVADLNIARIRRRLSTVRGETASQLQMALLVS